MSPEDPFKKIVNAIAEQGYCALEPPLPTSLLNNLQQYLSELGEGNFKRAGIGRQSEFQINNQERGDLIHWLQGDEPSVQEYFAWMERLRQALNRELFLGLFDYECHFARYPVGAFYKTHVDAFRGQSNRRLSTVLYLNQDFQPDDGGELVIYHPDSQQVLTTVVPHGGVMVLFLSDVFPHEVLPTKRERVSLTGWFRINGSVGDQIDPAS